MEASRFDEMLSNAFDTIPQEDSISTSKEANIDSAYNDKLSRIDPEAARIKSFEDGDSGTYMNDSGFRQRGLDTYETYHPDKYTNGVLTDQKDINRMERQRGRYSAQFGVPLDKVGYGDIYEQGAKEGINNLYNATKDRETKGFTPGDTRYYRNNELELGSNESPLDIAINKRSHGTGRYGREIVDMYNPNTGDNINKEGETGYNAALYTDGGKFDSDATFLSNVRKIAEEKGISEEEAASIAMFGENQPSNDSRLMTDTLTVGSGVAHILSNVMDYGSEKVADAAIALGIDDEAGMQATKDFWNKDGNIMKAFDERINLDKSLSQNATAELMANVKAGNYGSAALSVLENLDVHLAQSAPEMIAMAAGAPVFAAAILSRVQDQKTDFIKENNTEPSMQEEIGMMATNAAVLLAEKMLLVGPMKKLVASLAAKGGTSVKKSIGGILASTAGETVQEVADQTQEQYWRKGGSGDAQGMDALTAAIDKFKRGDVISKDEAISAGIAGGVMGGALRGGGESLSLAANTMANREIKANAQAQKDAGEYIDGEERDLAEGLDAMSFENDTNAAYETLDDADKSLDEATDLRGMFNSVNQTVRQIAKKIVFEKTSNIDSSKKEGYINLVKRLVSDAVTKDSEGARGFLTDTLGVDTSNMSNEEIMNLIDESSLENNDALLEIIAPKKAAEAFIHLVNGEQFDSIKEASKKILASKRGDIDVAAEKAKAFRSNYEEGKSKVEGERKNEVVNSKKVKKKAKRGLGGTLLDIVSFKNRGKEAAIKELNNYTNEALDLSLKDKDVDNEVKAYIRQLQGRRKKAVERVGIDKKYFDNIEDLSVIKGDKAETKNVISDIVKSKEIVDTRVRDEALNLIDSALEQGFITKGQHQLFRKRVEKISKDAIEPTQEQLDAEKEVDENKGTGDKEGKNKKKIEIDNQEIMDEALEVEEDLRDTLDKIEKLKENTSRTNEENADLTKLEKKLEGLSTKQINVSKTIMKVFELEAKKNDKHGSIIGNDLFDKSNKQTFDEFKNPQEAFSKEELAILGPICKG